MSGSPGRKRRADSDRSQAAILDAAARVLDAHPEASVETIAEAAGVTRQTVYAHFPSRERLLLAVLDRLTERTAAAMDAAEPDAGPAAAALERVIEAAAVEACRYPVLLQRINALPGSSRDDREQHTSIADRIAQVILRGRAAGEFDDGLPVDWLVAVTIRLAHVASEERDSGRMSEAEASRAMHTSLRRMLGVR
ncbi:TetR/AcrR family transcriptional regulator [Nocardia crassostreae]|uniref:TetR/AcrR family transcriptional regulator n=1 Tax=Nocardia crassostreae TaxID=53428 RepID=UPI00082D0083|nr:TetR/AcrR family transcriptional regulator [Nocardia crassostreae]